MHDIWPGEGTLAGLGQDLFGGNSLETADIVPFDTALPYTDRGDNLQINRGCPPGYFAQFVPAGTRGAVFVQIPDLVQGSYMRCRLMATTTPQTQAEETGQSAAQSWYDLTNTGLGAGFGNFLQALGWIPWIVGGYIGWEIFKEIRR